MFDEVHHLGTAPSWQNVGDTCGASRRFGFSGSPWATGLPYIDLGNDKESMFADFRVTSHVGETLVYIPSKMLREMGVIVDPTIYVIGVNAPKGLTRNPFPRWRWVYKRGIIENSHRNYLITEAAHRLHQRDHRTAILVVSIPHGKELLKRLHSYGLNAAFTKGNDEVLVYTGKKTKTIRDAGEEYRDAFLAGDIDVLIGSVVIDEAVDLPGMTALILAGGMKSPIRAVQRIGRAIRTAEGKDEAIVLDFRDRQHYFLNNHTNKRLGVYAAHEYDYEEVEWATLWEKL
jgi:superfamily II DNA or RNA helicase